MMFFVMRLYRPSSVSDWIFACLWEQEPAGALRDICSI